MKPLLSPISLASILLAPLLAAADTPRATYEIMAVQTRHTRSFVGLPPPRFRGANSIKVTFVPDPHRLCSLFVDGEVPENTVILACMLRNVETGQPTTMILPNPCAPPVAERYAFITCHELGHVNGWSGWHEE